MLVGTAARDEVELRARFHFLWRELPPTGSRQPTISYNSLDLSGLEAITIA
jgi:hypothetical protein